jgi:copper chaperone NosL
MRQILPATCFVEFIATTAFLTGLDIETNKPAMEPSKNRRRLLTLLPGAMALGFSLIACNREATQGPVPIDWGKDPDARCRMIISDKFFAAEIRGPDGKVAKFDDIGCAIFWLAKQGFDEHVAGVEFWVADHKTAKWLNALTASYIEGIRSPMRYQFAATAEKGEGMIGFDAMKAKILARGS